MIAPIKGVEDRHFCATRWTPGCPEAEDHYLSAYRAQIECLTIQFLDDQRRGRLTDIRGRARTRAEARKAQGFRLRGPRTKVVVSALIAPGR